MKTASGEELKRKVYHNFTLYVTHTFAYYKHNGYEGCDVDLEISLREYGLIWGKNNMCEEDEYHFIYYVGDYEYQDDKGKMHMFPMYDHSYLTKHDFRNMVIDNNWYDFDDVKSFVGFDGTVEEYVDNFPNNVNESISYYGHQNIFGSCYDRFPIIKYGEYNDYEG